MTRRSIVLFFWHNAICLIRSIMTPDLLPECLDQLIHKVFLDMAGSLNLFKVVDNRLGDPIQELCDRFPETDRRYLEGCFEW